MDKVPFVFFITLTYALFMSCGPEQGQGYGFGVGSEGPKEAETYQQLQVALQSKLKQCYGFSSQSGIIAESLIVKCDDGGKCDSDFADTCSTHIFVRSCPPQNARSHTLATDCLLINSKDRAVFIIGAN